MSKKPTKTTPVTHAEHFRLRLPSEKPTEKDTCEYGYVFCYLDNGAISIRPPSDINHDVITWLPGHLPAHLIPKPETAEERMRREFEEWAKSNGYDTDSFPAGDYQAPDTQCAWDGWQAAKTTP